MRKYQVKISEVEVPVYRLLLVLGLTVTITLAELLLAQLSHSITLLVLFHQNFYNVLTLVVSCVTRAREREAGAAISLQITRVCSHEWYYYTAACLPTSGRVQGGRVTDAAAPRRNVGAGPGRGAVVTCQGLVDIHSCSSRYARRKWAIAA